MDARFNKVMNEVASDKALGTKIVTFERYNDIMGTLERLAPEDEVKE